MKGRFTWISLAFLILGSLTLSMAQASQELIQKGEYHYHRSQVDSSLFYYKRAYQSEENGIKLQALGGMLMLTLLQSDLSRADSLVEVGDSISRSFEIDIVSLAKYKTSRGEYYLKSSRLQEALNEHREVIKLTAGHREAQLQHGYGLYYTALALERNSLYDSSLSYMSRAHDIFKKQLDTNSLEFGTIYNGMGICYYRANQYAEAEKYYLKSKAIAEAEVGLYSKDVAVCLSNLSGISRAEENYDEAIQYSELALKIYRVLNDQTGMASSYYGLGVYHYFQGDYGRTRDFMEACIKIREEAYGPDHYSLIGPQEVLGIAYEEAGDYQNTLHYLKKARQTILSNYSPGSIAEAYNYENTAICYRSIGELDSALHYIRKANSILPEKLSQGDYSLAVHYFSYANILYHLDELERAGGMLRQSEKIYQQLGMAESSEYAQNLALQALIYAEQDRWRQADQLFETALRKVQVAGEGAGQDSSYELTPNALWLLNEYSGYHFQKYKSTGEENALDRFEAYSQIYLDLSNRFRKQFIDPYTKSILVKDNAEVYGRNLGIYHSLYQKTGLRKHLEAAYNFSEYGRTSMLRDLQNDNIQSYAGVPDSVLQRERKLKMKITELQREYREDPESDSLKQALFHSKEALNAHIEHTLQRYPRYHQLKFSSKVPDLQRIQTELGKNQSLIEYMHDDTAYYALVIEASNADLLYLGNRKEVNTAIRQWKQSLTKRDENGLGSAGRFLCQKLWQPLEEALTHSRVTIVPTGPLFYLNFETLPSSQSAYLISDYNISYALSLSVLFSENEQADRPTAMAIAPGFEDDLKEQYRSGLDSQETLDEDYLKTVRQPWSLGLVQKLQNEYGLAALTGLEATETKVKAKIQKASMLYFGTHAIADAGDPMRSRLVLAKEAGEQKEDGYLHAYELFGLPLQAELAVLSACESGLGHLQEGEGMISLAYSLHYAGCPSTVMSLWKVDEKINTQISDQFLQYLDEGYKTSEALRQAKLDYLKNTGEPLDHPFYWAGMVLMGQDNTVQLEDQSWPWYYWLGAIIGALLLFVWLWRMWR